MSFIDATGRQRKRRRRAVSQRDAIRLRAQLVRELQAGVRTDARFAAFADEWLQAKRKIWAPGTYKRQEAIVRRHLLPAFGDQRLSDISPRDVRDLMDQSTGLAPRSVNYIRTVLRAMLGQAQRWELVTRNVAALVEPAPLPDRTVEPLTADQAWGLLDALEGEPLEALYTLAVMTGMRSGELLGLRWRDVDLEASRLQVEHQLQRIGGEWLFIAPKTAAGRRAVALPLPAVEALHRHRTRQNGERAEIGRHYVERDLVFTRPGGLPIHATTLVKDFQRLLARLGLPRRRFHDLRHTAVSIMLEQGVALTTIQDVVGHADFHLTKNTYGHLAESIKREAADKMATARARSTRPRNPARNPLRVVETGAGG
ncbi:MAG: site-specific integrase [Chloroflexi bacterium]|nr:site-specific integrase [Chloroflexota bacterium]MDA1147797.1 site-specific integrase [Chloroflexota bacterium]